MIVVTNVKIVNNSITNLNGVFSGETRTTGGQKWSSTPNIVQYILCVCGCIERKIQDVRYSKADETAISDLNNKSNTLDEPVTVAEWS
jgi:hypothetical protein